MKKLSLLLFILLLLIALPANAKRHEDNTYKMAYINLDWWEKYKDPILREYMLKIIFQENLHQVMFISEM